ncbi:bifunctional adenosylcobinamide kinase/adenosylcobinamide-phosphate guanylyltransferase [Rhodococcus kronopolitis]|uniref:Adenosylcobinamide kinase n=1 Tax=Rhodococcus kronopolitis TaxID=1460226 RepID=A0ABV9FV00_9NOCA
MELVLLGTGAADGWPNPFCTCASCSLAAERGEIRGQTAALVDDVLLLDCGPEAPRAALRAGRTLAGVRHILLTHAHPDHVGPAALLFRSWAGRPEPLDVVGPPEALELCRDWVGPDDLVRFVPVAAGETVRVGGYTVRVRAAAHWAVRPGEVPGDGDAVLYDLTGPDRRRLLWATDTGPLPDVTLAAVAGAEYDAVFLEETFGAKTDHGADHLDLASFPRALAALREADAITDRTDVVAVHLGHHNPPLPELAERLGHWGARVLDDGAVLEIGPGPDRSAVAPVSAPSRTLVLGGARAGKSTYAEGVLAAEPRVLYLATGVVDDGDADWARRVAAHRARRPAGWHTVETTDVAAALRAAREPVLFDCVGTWLAGRIDHHKAWDSGDFADVEADVADLFAAWRGAPVRVVAVSNEVGSGVVPATASGRRFRDLLGRVNAALAAESETVVLVTAGLPAALRGTTPGQRAR